MNKKFDFTFKKFTEILDCLLYNGYSFQSLEDFLYNPGEKVVILRHDVDRSPLLSLNTAKLENSKGIRGTYYFRIVKESNNPGVMKEIVELGHEIGYHYEDVARCAVSGLRYGGENGSKAQRRKPPSPGLRWSKDPMAEEELVKVAIESFRVNLERLREIVPIKTICMHGSPMSRWDSRILWKYYDYRDFGIIGEPYIDLDFDKVLYLTDTGRKWNGDKSNVRDKISRENFPVLKRRLKNSDNIIAAVSANELPRHIMITVHPQRWSDNPFVWISEYTVQTLKNRVKQLIFVR